MRRRRKGKEHVTFKIFSASSLSLSLSLRVGGGGRDEPHPPPPIPRPELGSSPPARRVSNDGS